MSRHTVLALADTAPLCSLTLKAALLPAHARQPWCRPQSPAHTKVIDGVRIFWAGEKCKRGICMYITAFSFYYGAVFTQVHRSMGKIRFAMVGFLPLLKGQSEFSEYATVNDHGS